MFPVYYIIFMSDLVSQNLNMIFKTPKGETVHALKDLNFTLKKGELLTVLGPSGSGKTTLKKISLSEMPDYLSENYKKYANWLEI